jgi:OmcA/MtrC family decaheme c-type cytochrome
MFNPIAPGARVHGSLRAVRPHGSGRPRTARTALRAPSRAVAGNAAAMVRDRGWQPLARGVVLLCVLLLLGTLLASCSGSTGSSGAAGPAGTNTPVGNGLRNVSTATAITGQVTAVAINGPPVVNFQLVDQDGVALSGLPSADIAFGVAKLVPGQNGASSYWASYIYSTVKPAACPIGVASCATVPKVQANVENGATGTLVDNGDGTYVYTFKKDITSDPLVNFDPNLTHRVGFEIRGLAQANNGSLTFQPATGDTTGITSREIVDTATCDGCHTRLSAHGGARVDVQYCVLCHNPGTSDPNSGNSLDMEVMIHKVHAGSSLPSISNYVAGTSNPTPILGQGYWIVGYGDSLSNFNTVVYPQDTRNCQACHAQNHPNLTEAANFKTVPTIAACGACHDNVNFATGLNHSTNIIANNTQCSTCHGATSAIDGGKLQVLTAHLIPERVFQARFAYNILSATNTGAGQSPVIRFSITDPTNGNRPWNLVSDEPFTYCAGSAPTNPNIAIAWSTTDYTNVGSGVTSEVAQPFSIKVACATSNAPTANGDGSYTVTSPTAIPGSVTGTAGLLFQGHPGHDFADGRGPQEIPVPNAVGYAAVTDTAAVPRRTVADVKKCDTCHDQLNAHGSNRVDSVQACAFCHNPNATDVLARSGTPTFITPSNPSPLDHLAEQTIDLKVMIHAIHAPTYRASQGGVPYVVYHRGAPTDFSKETPFPGLINNCLACHATDTYYPPDPTTSTALATTINTYSDTAPLTTPAGETAVTPAASACSSCHQSALASLHMVQNGGNFSVIKDVSSHFPLQANSTETCTLCHGPGAVADVKVVHNLAALQ